MIIKFNLLLNWIGFKNYGNDKIRIWDNKNIIRAPIKKYVFLPTLSTINPITGANIIGIRYVTDIN